MCGRYTLTRPDALQLRFDVLFEEAGTEYQPRYNIAPTQDVPVIVARDALVPALRFPRERERTSERESDPQGMERALTQMRWGFQPAWARETAPRLAPINARAETLAEKPLFRAAFARNRCLVVADGYYEWRAEAGVRTKQPFYFRLRDGSLFGFAGLYTDGQEATCTLITTTPNSVAEAVHNRMPAILLPEQESLWLDPHVTQIDILRQCLRPYPADLMEAYPVGPAVSFARAEGPQLIAAL